jgi:tight adherence protein B
VGSGLFFPVLVLVTVLALAPLVLFHDTRRKRLLRRVETVTAIDAVPRAEPEQRRSIRIARRRNARLNDLGYGLLRLPVDLPQAHVVPTWLVFAAGILFAVMEGWFAHLFVAMPLAALSGVMSGILVLRGTFGWEHARYARRLLGQMPDTIALVVSATRAGLPVSEAFRAVSREMPPPTRDEFGRVVNEMALGLPPNEALMALHRRTRVAEYAIFAVTLAVQTRSGGRLSETVQNLAETVRQRLTIAARAEALAAEAKLSARVISAMPFVGGATMSFVQPGYLDPLFHDPRGKRLFVIGVTTLILGILTMRRLIQGVTRE